MTNSVFSEFLRVLLILLGLGGAALLTFLSQAVLARYFSPQEFGLYNTIMTLAVMIAPFSAFGVTSFWLRAYGKEGWSAARWMKPTRTLLLAYSCITATSYLFVVSIDWFDSARAQQYSQYLLPFVLLLALSNLYVAQCQLENRFYGIAVARLIAPTLRLTIAVACVNWMLDLGDAFILFSGLSLLVALGFAIKVRPIFSTRISLAGHGERPQFDLSTKVPTLREAFHQSYPFGMWDNLNLVFTQIPILLVSALYSLEESGLYVIAFSFVALAYLLPTALYATYLMPKLQRWAEHDQQKLFQVYSLGNGFMLLSGLLVAITLSALAPYLVRLLYGVQYMDAAGILRWLAWSVPLRYLATNLQSPLTTKGLIRSNVRRIIFGLIALISLCALFIPIYGANGAVLAVIGGQIFLVCLYFAGIRKHVFGDQAFKALSFRFGSLRKT